MRCTRAWMEGPPPTPMCRMTVRTKPDSNADVPHDRVDAMFDPGGQAPSASATRVLSVDILGKGPLWRPPLGCYTDVRSVEVREVAMKVTREDRERFEREHLSPLAMLAVDAAPRETPIPRDAYRTEFQRDRDRIIHCKSFRRLSHKTQVFLAPEGDHYRTRLTHTLEVAQISRTVARALGLNEDLTEAIALGHDLGHTPFGHTGEQALADCIAERMGIDPDSDEGRDLFRHNRQSLRVVEVLEKDGEGLNLTVEVRDGIMCHTGSQKARSLEGRIVATADRIAYVNHDIDDAIRAEVIAETDLPAGPHEVLGPNHSARISTLVGDMIAASDGTGDIVMSQPVWDALQELRAFLFDNVYTSPVAKGEDTKAVSLIQSLFWYYIDHFDEVPTEQRRTARDHPSEIMPDDPVCSAIVDHIAGMTDRYARNVFADLFIPRNWH